MARLQCLEPQRRDLDVSVDVEAGVLAGQHHAPVIHQRHVKTLSMLHLVTKYTDNIILLTVFTFVYFSHLALESRNKLAVLAEHGQVEVVVVVGDGDLPRGVNADTDWVVGNPCNVKNRKDGNKI